MDLRSKQFGMLVALHKKIDGGRVKWVCQCRCGKKKLVRQEDLLAERTRSCGCAKTQLKRAKAEKKYSLVNQRFGRLFVLWKSKTKTGRSMMWDCRCDCGTITKVSGTKLRTGKTKSCGCIQEATRILYQYADGEIDFDGFVTSCKQVLKGNR